MSKHKIIILLQISIMIIFYICACIYNFNTNDCNDKISTINCSLTAISNEKKCTKENTSYIIEELEEMFPCVVFKYYRVYVSLYYSI